MLTYRADRVVGVAMGDVGGAAVAVLVPVVTAVGGVVSLLVQDWQARRSRASDRQRTFEEASRQVAFATEWWKAQQLLPLEPEALQEASMMAQGWLKSASTQVIEADRARLDQVEPVSRGRLLLFYGFNRPFAKVIRSGFHATVACLAYYSFRLFQNAIFGHAELWETQTLILLSVLALLLRFWAVSADSPPRHPDAAPTLPTA